MAGDITDGLELERRRARGYPVVLIGDWNIARGRLDAVPPLRTWGPHVPARAQLNDEIMPALDLVDVFRARNPTARAFTWFSGWAQTIDAARVDYALVSASLVERVRSAEIEPPPARDAVSDHSPLWISLDLD